MWMCHSSQVFVIVLSNFTNPTSPVGYCAWGTISDRELGIDFSTSDGNWTYRNGYFFFAFPRGIGFPILRRGSSTNSWGLFAACNAFIPPWGIAPIILFVGLAINQDAFNVVETRHVPAAIIGLFPQTADWILSIWPDAPKVKPGLEELDIIATLMKGHHCRDFAWHGLLIRLMFSKGWSDLYGKIKSAIGS